MSVSLHLRPIQNSRTASRAFDDETVVIDPDTNVARMFNGVGSRVWELVDGQHTVADIAAILETEYAVSTSEALASVTHFVEALVQRDLITFTSS
jgi:hypothetical protein